MLSSITDIQSPQQHATLWSKRYMVASLITNSTAKLCPSFFLLLLSRFLIPQDFALPSHCTTSPHALPPPPPRPATNRSVARRLEGLSLLPPPPLALTHTEAARGERSSPAQRQVRKRRRRGGGGGGSWEAAGSQRHATEE